MVDRIRGRDRHNTISDLAADSAVVLRPRKLTARNPNTTGPTATCGWCKRRNIPYSRHYSGPHKLNLKEHRCVER